jgi:hypothetical protein
VEIPLLAPSDKMTAADLIAAAQRLGDDEIEAETAAWLATRAPDAAANELLAVAAGGGPAERMLAVATVQKLGGDAEPAWRDSLGRPELRPYAKIALTEIVGGEPAVAALDSLKPEAADIAWLLIDMLAALSDGPGELPPMGEVIPPGQEQEIFDAVSLSRHPDAAAVLSVIGRHHPDRRVAKAAPTSAYRAGSRPEPR